MKTYSPGSKLELERNPSWDKATDPARTGLPDSIVLDMGLQGDVINQRLVADAGDDKFSATTGTSVPAALILTDSPVVPLVYARNAFLCRTRRCRTSTCRPTRRTRTR